MPVFTSACPRNCYSTCSLRVTVEKGKVTAIDAHPGNRATPEGPCLKGLSYLERVEPASRLLAPMLRGTDGGFAPVSWDAALDLMAERFLDIRERFGPQAVMYYAGSGTKGLLNGNSMAFWRRFGGCTTTYGDLCWPAGLEATRLTLGDNRHNAPWDLANAALIVMWGKNAAETNVHQMRFVDQALAAGGRLVVIDPRRTPTAERAALLVQPRPGTDAALALALAHVLIRDGLADRAFIDAHVLGFEAYARAVEAWTPQRCEGVTGVPAGEVEALARELGTTRPLTICAGFGMQRYTNSGQTMRAILALLAITGNLGRPGAGWVYANLQSDVFSAVKDPLDFFPPERPDGVARVSLSTARLGRDMAAQAGPPLKAAWVERGNPVSQNPDTARVREAFRALEFRVVVDERLTDTAREADLVLPAKSLFEQTDVIGAYWHPYLQIRPKLLEPPGEVKPESEILWHLALRMGLATDGLVAPGGEEAWLEAKLGRFPGLTLEALREGPVLAPGCEEVAFADLAFPTPSGRIELLSEEAARRWSVDPLPGHSAPLESSPGAYPLTLLTPNHKNSIHSQFVTLSCLRDPGPRLHLGPGDAAARGIRQGDRVRVFNARGELFLPANLDLSLLPGCVVAFNGYGAEHGGSVNLLSLGRETDMAHGAAFHDNLVDVEKAP
ncbi:molybdopterin-dependent oxidoreductase [Geothrix sp. 21YS21S-2]|uniref:molybdopterin-containing oxidoreductase family protein n=1 Tax=Geothrix sp. 21YS21S-2 TaxID=3068893 RepID=UPI0027B9A1E2|nr:molybdopterin-dependent oxidoreductase [Geothrix sp. 21YS21S-2]